MQEELNTEVQDQIAPVEEQAPPPEKMLTQSQVNLIVAREKQNAADRARRQMAQEAAQQNQGMGGMQQHSNQDIENMVSERVQKEFMQKQQEYQRSLHEQHAGQMANDFLGKIDLGKQGDPDYEHTFKDVDFREIADLVPLINLTENSYLVTKELLNNPEKIANLRSLVKDSPNLASRAMSKLSDSIKSNQGALSQQKTVNDPLSQILPSTVGTDNGSMTIRDFKKQPWLRG